MTVVYNVNPAAVSELWTTKNKTFHGVSDKGGDILLMQNYVALSARNAAYKVAREYESLKMADNRQTIEQKIRDSIIKTLNEEKLAEKITVSQVQVRAITPADVIVTSANELVRAQNELRTKEVEVQTAKKEAERIAALNANAGAIGYMNAMANLKIDEGVANGKCKPSWCRMTSRASSTRSEEPFGGAHAADCCNTTGAWPAPVAATSSKKSDKAFGLHDETVSWMVRAVELGLGGSDGSVQCKT